MKKNITVNIFGSLYPMDEDAYAMLNAYIINMREYFSRRPDGKEIADDIEARAAELMSELMRSGVEAVSIEHVNDIIGRIGNPEQMYSDDSEERDNLEECIETEDGSEQCTQSSKRKLFRNTDHKVIGGVCSGLAAYLGIKPIWIRLLALILIWPTFGIIIAVYLLGWMLIPAASTPADRLLMKGKPVNVSNICEEFLTSAREMIDRNGNIGFESGISRGFTAFMKWTLVTLGAFLVVCCIITFLISIISFVGAISSPWREMRDVIGDEFPLYMLVDEILDHNPLWLCLICFVSLLLFLILSIYGLMHTMLHLFGKVKVLSPRLRVACVSVWLLSFLVCVVSFSNVISTVMIYEEYNHKVYYEKHKAELEAKKREHYLGYLNNAGWTLVKDENVRDGYSRNDKHFSGEEVRYLHAGSNGDGMQYEVVRREKVAPGLYTLKAAGRADGEGAEIFAVNGKNSRYSAPIPVCDNYGGTIWRNAKTLLENDSAGLRPDRQYLQKLAQVHQNQGYGWSEILIDNITVGQDSILTYGVTNVSPVHSWDGTWFSATAFELEKKSGK